MRNVRWLTKIFTFAAILVLMGSPPAQAFADLLDTPTESTTPALSTTSTEENLPAEDSEDPADTSIITSNEITSEAQSGDASVTANTAAGDATSGDATAEANLLTVVSSTTSFDDSNLPIFSLHLGGDASGDILLSPDILTQPTTGTTSSIIEVNSSDDIQINNKLTVTAVSGSATVSGNMTAGSATTGNSTATANIVNIINSSVSASQAFLGIITIEGNLVGDILVPSQFLGNLLAPASPLPATDTPSDVTQQQMVSNNVTTTAQSGSAIVAENRTAGSATSGDATTLVTLLNLINTNVTGDNVLMVFVNVLGQWSGTSTNAPGGTSIILGIDEGNGSQATSNASSASINARIDNQISVTATTGNAKVENNVTAGSATSGDAKAIVNVLNIVNSSISSGQWFGVLFINVFGNWTGSFGYQQPPTIPPTSENEAPAPTQAPAVPTPAFVPVARKYQKLPNSFIPQPTVPAQVLAAVIQSPAQPETNNNLDDKGSTIVPTVVTITAVILIIASLIALRRKVNG